MFPLLPIETPAQLHAYTKAIVKEVVAELKDPAPDHITLKEAKTVLNIGYTPLRKRLEKAGVRTYSHGKEKAFDRKLLYKLRT